MSKLYDINDTLKGLYLLNFYKKKMLLMRWCVKVGVVKLLRVLNYFYLIIKATISYSLLLSYTLIH